MAEETEPRLCVKCGDVIIIRGEKENIVRICKGCGIKYGVEGERPGGFGVGSPEESCNCRISALEDDVAELKKRNRLLVQVCRILGKKLAQNYPLGWEESGLIEAAELIKSIDKSDETPEG